MRIAWWGFGFLIPNAIAADGCYHTRHSLIKELRTQCHEVIWIGKHRDKDLTNIPSDALYNILNTNKDYHVKAHEAMSRNKLYSNVTDKTWTWYFRELHMKRQDLPDIDFAIIELSAMGLSRYEIISIIKHYTDKHIKCFLYDKDFWGTGFYRCFDRCDIDDNYVYFLTPYSEQRLKNQIIFYFGYDRDKEIKNIYDHIGPPFIYLGNDYKRGSKLIKFYSTLNCHIIGNFNKDKENIVDIIGKKKFLGPCVPNRVFPIMSTYAATIQVLPKLYERVGQQTQRTNEASLAGLILFMDKDIKDAEKFTLKDQIISSADEATKKLLYYIQHNEVEDRVNVQRTLAPTYKKELEKIWEVL